MVRCAEHPADCVLKRAVQGVFLILAIVTTLALPRAAQAFQTYAPPFTPFVVEDDPGGYLVDRVREIRMLQAMNKPVEIRGAYCHSTCTMFLGMPDVCVSPTTVFGFHGPSYAGAPLDAALFERASRIIAGHYPVELRDWYLRTARHRIDGLHQVTGERLIAMGVRSCQSGDPDTM